VDASVIVKWYVLENERAQALQLRDDYLDGKVKLVSPAIMPFEVLNVIRHAQRGMKSTTLASIASSIQLYGIALYGFEDGYTKILAETSVDNDITIYDACYVALANYLDSVLYTADKRLIDMLNIQSKEHVKDIASYKLDKTK